MEMPDIPNLLFVLSIPKDLFILLRYFHLPQVKKGSLGGSHATPVIQCSAGLFLLYGMGLDSGEFAEPVQPPIQPFRGCLASFRLVSICQLFAL